MIKIRFIYEGETIEVKRVPLRVSHEAEMALGVGMSDSDSSRLLVLLYVGLKQKFPDRDPVSIADEVMDFDLFELDADDEAAGAPLVETNGEVPESQLPTGLPPSEVSG